jgi:hypothetical protein
MSIRYIQAAVSSEEHEDIRNFAFHHKLSLTELVTAALKWYMKEVRKEEAKKKIRQGESKRVGGSI